jgi:DNA polymerase elongation subunit (family B)
MNEYKQKQEDTGQDFSAEIAKAHNMQMAKKIQLNSAYGALGNNFFRWFDIRYAESITLSGQLSIRWMERNINEYLNKTLKTEDIDYVIACDTDSMYITLDKMVESIFEPNTPHKKIVDWMDKVAEEVFEPFIDKHYQDLAKYTNAYEQKMFMKREALADKGIWTAKKRYALHVHDMEGVRFKQPYMKIQGMETQRSSVPQICRDKMKAAMELIMVKDEHALVEFVEDFRQEFKSLPFEDVAFPRGVKGIDKYKNSVTLYNKGTPIHVRGALVYNHLLTE